MLRLFFTFFSRFPSRDLFFLILIDDDWTNEKIDNGEQL